MSDTAIRERRVSGAVDTHGNETESWEESAMPGCLFDPGGSYEPRQRNAYRVTTEPTLFVPARYGPPEPEDFYRIRGKRYGVEGEAADWLSGDTNWDPGYIVVRLRRDEG